MDDAETFNCTITDWDYLYARCRDVSDEVRAADFEPDVIVALARGGWFAGRCLCDFLGLDDLTSLKMEHYVGTGETADEPQVRYPMPDGTLEGKDVLIVDDIADTGGSIEHAYEYVTDRTDGTVRTATLQLLQTSRFEPDFVGEQLETWTWVVYPWNFIEDLSELIERVLSAVDADAVDRETIRGKLAEWYDIGRIEMETAQPDRLEEVLEEMVRRDVIEQVDDDEWTLAAIE